MQSEITLKNLGGEHHPGQLRRWTVHSGKMIFFRHSTPSAEWTRLGEKLKLKKFIIFT